MGTFNEEVEKLIQELTSEIMQEYDSTREISVRVNLLPVNHNAMSKYEKENDEAIIKQNNGAIKSVNPQNEHAIPHYVAIHETSVGKTATMAQGVETSSEEVERPDKPEAWKKNFVRYDNMARFGPYKDQRRYGSTIAYHARIDYPGMLGRPEIVILMPAVCSPDQITNKEFTKYTYGIERCVGEEQNYHMAIANQAMLTAFLLKELGFNTESVSHHVLPHNSLAKNNKACPARMLYASTLLRKSMLQPLTEQEMKDLREYVPWEVFIVLVKIFLERNKFPQELEEKFIFDMDDYMAYIKNPDGYNYRKRKQLGVIKRKYDIQFVKPSDIEETER